MIIALLTAMAWAVLNGLFVVFGLFSFAVPKQIESSIGILLSQANLYSGVFPVSDLFLALYSVLIFWILIYGIKLVLSLLNMIPGINFRLPKHRQK